MKQKYFSAILLLLSLMTPLAALADSFKVNPVNLEPGKTGTLTFTLDNENDCYGFQAEVKLPDGIEAVKVPGSVTDKYDVTLSERAPSGKYEVESNILSSGNLIIGAYSTSNPQQPFTGNSGVLVNLKVFVSENFKGGTVYVSNIMLIDSNDKDVVLDDTRAKIGVAATGITLSETSKELKVDDTFTLIATVTPESTSDKKVVWSSDDETIATVDEDGNVTAIALGETTITASCGNVNAICKVNVVPTPVESVSFTRKTLTLSLTEEGNKTTTLEPNFIPTTATYKSVTWKSSDESVATVSADGLVTAIKLGTTTITATSSNGKEATCVVTVSDNLIHVTSITISNTELSLTAGDKATLTATITPDNADTSVEWASENTQVATVSETGEVTAIKAGTTKITATSFDGKTATCTVTVAAKIILPTGVTLGTTSAELEVGEALPLKATVAPADATDKSLVWSSSDEKVATVDQKGNVTAVAAGQAIITVASKAAPEVKAECKVTVIVPVTSLAILDENNKKISASTVIGLVIGDEYTLTEVVSPTNATDQIVTWSSKDESIAKIVDIVEEPHQVHLDAIGKGETTITASLGGFSVSFKVTVNEPVIAITGISLDKTKADMVVGGDPLQLTATIAPANATSKEVKWTSSDNTKATVSTTGKVTALKSGTVTITATANKFTATCEITITDPVVEVSAITLDKTKAEVEIGKSITLKATVTPEDATEKTVTWTSSDDKVATVDKDGNVTGVAMGNATITAKAGDKTATCTVTVLKGTGVDLGFDSEAPVQVYDLNGRYVADKVEGLVAGVYIIRQGNTVKKICIR